MIHVKNILCLFSVLSFTFIATAAEVWEPKPGTGHETNVWRRLVVYGDQWSRHELAGHGGSQNRFRNYYNPYVGQSAKDGQDGYINNNDFYDADNDGNTNDGYVCYLEFSETERLGMGDWPTAGIYPTPTSWRFYGGATWNISDSTFGNSSYTEEQGMNADHNGIFAESTEDHPLNGQPDSSDPNSRIKMYWTIVWKKSDFLNGGSNGVVSIGPNSRFSLTFDRYWEGIDVVRFVIKDSGQYYSHEKAFSFDLSGGTPYHFVLNPTNVLWAQYNPNGYDIRFKTNQIFSINANSFTNIETVGYYIAKDSSRSGMFHTKWYNFEADAYVKNKFRPSEHIDMAEITGSGGVQDFYMSTCEVPFKLWNNIYRYADSVNIANEGRYNFMKDGDMGSMQYGTNFHNNQEPVVNFTLYDMTAWCNALSEKEGLTPVFYGDPACTIIFKYTNITTRASITYADHNFKNPDYTFLPDQPLYVKWGADGYRPPTPAEWEVGYGGQSDDESTAWRDSNSSGQTHEVGTKAANANGLYDMAGNVWEFTWIYGDVYVPDTSSSIMAIGGGFHYPNDPRTAANSASPYGDIPFDGRYDIGLRLVRRDSGLATPAAGAIPSADNAYETTGIHKWKFKDDYKTAAASPAPSTNNILEMATIPGGTFYRDIGNSKWDQVSIYPLEMSKHEISYEKWLKVYFWGIENGYEFDYDGAMGSMRWWDFTHYSNEPVVAIPWHSMIVWCNALSEMEGFAPVYYTNDALTIVYRKAMKLRGTKEPVESLLNGKGFAEGAYREPWLFANWANDGYRLPTTAEWEYAARGGLEKKSNVWPDGGIYTDYIWEIRNSGGHTHPVGQLSTNGYGLYDIMGNAGEALWGTKDGEYLDRDYYEDLNNPKASKYGGWQEPKTFSNIKRNSIVAGNSFFWSESTSIANSINANQIWDNHNESDIGFRVVKCESNVHPTNGLEELVIKIWLDYDTNDFDKLQGKCAQGNLFRDGQYNQNGVASNAVIKWTFNAGSPIKSSPVVVDDVVYFGADNGFYAIDSVSGTQKWKISIPDGVQSSPCIVDDVIYFGGLDKKLYAVYTNGIIKWAVWSDQSELTYLRKPIYSAIAVAYTTVFAIVNSTVKGFAIEDGNLFYDSIANSYWDESAVSMNENFVVYGFHNGAVSRRLSLRDGKVKYGASGAGSYSRGSAAIHDGVFYAPYAGGNFVGGDANYAAYKAVTVTNMSMIYAKYTDDFLPLDEKTACFSSPAICNDQLILGVDSGMLYSYALADGTCKTNFFRSSGPIRCPITVSAPDNTIYFGTLDDNIYAVDGTSGEKRWEIKTSGDISSAACVYNENIFVGCEDGLIYCIEKSDLLEIIASPNPLDINEGTSKTLYIRLSQQPAGDVSVHVSKFSGDSDISISGGATNLTFASTDWNVFQEVTVIAAEDDGDSENGTATIRCAASGIPLVDVIVNEIDNDQKIIVSATEVDVPENGTAVFKVKMNSSLGLPLTVSVSRYSGDANISVSSGSSLYFTDADVWQTVTLAAADDGDMTGGTAVFRCSATGLDNVDVTATEIDDDIPRIVTSTDKVSVWEGSNETFGIKLNIDPLMAVTVLVENATGDSDISVLPPTNFFFDSGNFSIFQNVTLEAALDSDKYSSSASIRCYSADIANDVFVTATEIDTNVPMYSINFQDGIDDYAGTVDTWVKSWSGGDDNQGSYTYSPIHSNIRFPLIKWDLSDLPSTAVFNSATISLTLVLETGQTDETKINAYAIKTPWTEYGATYNTSNGTNAWNIGSSDGGDWGALVGNVISPASSVGDKPVINFQLNAAGLNYLKESSTNSAVNCGFLFVIEDTTAVQRRCYLSEEGTISRRPKLSVLYQIANVPQNGSVIINNGDLQTTNFVVELILFAENPTPEEMRISENINFIGASWTNYMTNITFEFSMSYEQKTIYTQFSDGGVGISETVSDTINLIPEPGGIVFGMIALCALLSCSVRVSAPRMPGQ